MSELESWLAESSAGIGPADRPLVTLTYAQSLDGSISLRRGRTLALSGEASRRMTHWLRTQHDAILVGVGTVLADDPQLTVRYAEGPSPRPIVVDSRLRTPPSARLMQHPQHPLIATLKSMSGSKAARALAGAGANLLPVAKNADGRVDLRDLLRALRQRGVRSVMVEGGARIITAFLRDRLADRTIVTIAPVFAGGLRAVEARMPEPLPRMKHPCSAQYGDDVVVWGEF